MAIVALLLLLPVLTIAIIGNQQIFNAYLVWAEQNANLIFFGRKMPTTWLITLDSIVSVSFLARRGNVLATLVEEISGTTRNNQDRNWQPRGSDRLHLLWQRAQQSRRSSEQKFQSAG